MTKGNHMKIVPVYLLLFFYVLLNAPILDVFTSGVGVMFLKFLYWVAVVGYIWIVIGNQRPRIRRVRDKLQIITIILLLYFMIYFFMGLFFGYQRSPYSHTLPSLLSNIWKFIPIVVLQEYARYTIVNYGRKHFVWYVMIVLLFVFIDVDLSLIFNRFDTIESAFKFTCSDLLPSIFKNILLVFMARNVGFKGLLLYQLSFEFFDLLIPIFPDLDWFLIGIVRMILPVILYFNLNYIEMNDRQELTRKELRKESPLRLVPTLIVVLFIVGFVGGFFKYQPIAIMSNSMVPKFSRGDAVIVERITDEEKTRLKKGTIIRFQTAEKEIVHRILRRVKKEDGTISYITKGDNNNTEDIGEVLPEQIQGVVTGVVPKIGYPSVWLYELFQKK